MRFFADGPNIPDELLEARDNGNVVFFCGSGVSQPVGLPGFLGLAKQVTTKLGTPLDAKSRALLNRADQDPDFAPPLDQIFYLLQQEYGAGIIDDTVSELLKTPTNAKVDYHSIILRLSRNAARQPQLVTTNFDLLFERADKTIRTHVPPVLPDIALGQPLHGLVYLHGRRSARPAGGATRQGLVIGSADFGRAYLADGWATKFVRDLLRNYVIVLLGYSAADPPVRYLLEGLHSRGDSQSSTIYTFDQGTELDVHDRWRDRGVRPLAYAKSDHSHRALWDTLRAWADRSDDPDAWRRSIISLAGQGPRNLQAYQRGQVASLVRSLPGAKLFADTDPAPPAEWLCVFDRYTRYADPQKAFGEQTEFDPLIHYGLDDDPPRPQKSAPRAEIVGDDLISSNSFDERLEDRKRLAGMGGRWADPITPRLFHLGRWISKVVDNPAVVWWIAGYHTIHPGLLNQIEWQIERSGHQYHDSAYQAWTLLLEKFRHAPENEHDFDWYQFLPKLKKTGWTKHTLREFERVVQPYLGTHRPWGSKPCPPQKKWSDLRLQDLVTFEVNFPPRDAQKQNLTIPTEQLPEVFRIVRRAMERGSDLLAEINTQYWHTATFHPEQSAGERYLDEPSVFLHWAASLFDRLAIEHPDFARSEVERWRSNDEFFFNKFKLYAWMKSQLFSGAQAAAGLLAISGDGFWETYHRRELLHTLRARWTDFSLMERDRIEARIIAGPARWNGEEEKKYEQRKSITAAMILGWLEQQGCTISTSSHRLLPELRKAEPRWEPSWDVTADDSHEGRSGFVRTEPDPSKIISVPLSELIASAKQNTAQQFGEFTRYEPFQGVVQERPSRALAALAYEARHGRYPVEFWSTIISHWPDNTSERLRSLLARRIIRLPTEVIAELKYGVPDWFKKYLPTLAKSSLPNALTLWDAIIDHFFAADAKNTQSGLGEMMIAGKPQNRSRRTYEHAINSPIGRMAETLFEILDGMKLKGKSGIPPEIRSRLERLFQAPGEGTDHAISETAIRLRWLHYLDPDWTRERVVPFFEINNAYAEPAWNGFLHSNQLPNAELFDLLKPHFLNVFRCISSWAWSDGAVQRLNEFLVIACYWNKKDARYVSYDEARVALQNTDEEGRSQAAWFLGTVVRDQKAWKSFGKPFIQNAWPREARYQTERASQQFALMAEDAGNHFPDVAQTIIPLLVPVGYLSLLIHRMKKEDREEGTELPSKYPEPMLALLDRLVPDDPRVAPYDLGSVLTMIANAAPHLRQDQRLRRLNNLIK